MSKDDKSNNSPRSHWNDALLRGRKAVVWTTGALLKLAGVIEILGGLLTIALANMDEKPTESLVWGTLTTLLGLMLLYPGVKIARKAKQM